MKLAKLLFLLLPFNQCIAQIIITHKELASFTKSALQVVKFDEYISKDGHSYKIGYTLKIGRPSNNKTFSFITVSSTANALLGVQPEALSVSQSGTKSVIKSIIVGGTKKTGFKIFFVGKGTCGICGNNILDFEQALSTGEVVSKGLTREQAIAKLKEAKDLLDLGLLKQEDYEMLKSELTPIIMKQ